MFPANAPRYMHISVDDVIEILRELDLNGYQSVWDHPIFSMFQRLNQQYGAVFSLYSFYETNDGLWTLDHMTTQFRDEFRQASHWLRFGFHGYSYKSDYGYSENSIPCQVAKNHYTLVVNAICKFAGSSAIDTIPRIHFYQGQRETVRSWKRNQLGLKGLLSADDGRDEVYYLNRKQREILISSDDYYDFDEKLYFIHTDIRLENELNPALALDARLIDPVYKNQQRIQCIFTHEDQLKQESIRKKIEDCCRWATAYDFHFLFPMDCLPFQN
ncbi:hypothetical protein [Bacillus sp. Marseille-P3661]|uniref:hypothetical protein n=1 Tax=Bacillus sp. Marseille-P3661 TaxID=1936234 RepID=UPI000C831A47|nr:hypothetical protein [Bacillus sp. Marseille-P3661]